MRRILIALPILLQTYTAHAIDIDEGGLGEMSGLETYIYRNNTTIAGTETRLVAERPLGDYYVIFVDNIGGYAHYNTMINMHNGEPTHLHLGNPGAGKISHVEVTNGNTKNNVTLDGNTDLTTQGDFGYVASAWSGNSITITNGHVDRITGTMTKELIELKIEADGGLGGTGGQDVKARTAQISGRTDNVQLHVDKLNLDGKMSFDTSSHLGTRGGVVETNGENIGPNIVIEREGAIELVDHEDTTQTEYYGIEATGTPDVSITNYGHISATSSTTNSELNNVAGIGLSGGTVTNYGEINSTQFALVSGGGETTFVNNGTVTGAVGRNATREGKLTFSNEGTWNVRSDPLDAERKTIIDDVLNYGLITTIATDDGDHKLRSRRLMNAGEIDVRENTLELMGDYRGVNGKLTTRTTLGGDESPSTQLIINGNSSGTTAVAVENAGGNGATTIDGITLVKVNGTDTSEFKEDGRITAGAYDYRLVRYETNDGTEWRLSSENNPDPGPVPPGPVPPGPVPPGPVPPGPVPPGPKPKPVHKYRPEAVSYSENLRQANTLFLTSDNQRRAVGEYTDPVTGRTETSSLWLSQTGGHATRHDTSGQLKTAYNSYATQLGGTVLSLPAGDDGRLEAGVQAGYGRASGDSRSALT
ncbi:TPA: autotransporter outer membrane beta-barrel domain-containing protein, partial [Salmonella enterica subsp. diarizonae]